MRHWQTPLIPIMLLGFPHLVEYHHCSSACSKGITTRKCIGDSVYTRSVPTTACCCARLTLRLVHCATSSQKGERHHSHHYHRVSRFTPSIALLTMTFAPSSSSSSSNSAASVATRLEALMESKDDKEYKSHCTTVSWADLIRLDRHLNDIPRWPPHTQVTLRPKVGADCLMVLHVAGDLRSTRSAVEKFDRNGMYRTVQMRSALLAVDVDNDPLGRLMANELGVHHICQCLNQLDKGWLSGYELGQNTAAALSDCYHMCEALASEVETVGGETVPVIRCFRSSKKSSVSEYMVEIMRRCDKARGNLPFSSAGSTPSLYPLLYRADNGRPSFSLVGYASCSMDADDSQLFKELMAMTDVQPTASARAADASGSRKAIKGLWESQAQQSIVYESQALEGMRLHQAIEQRLAASGRSFDSFTELQCLVVVPNLNSLHMQTAARVSSLPGLKDIVKVMKATKASGNERTIDELCTDIGRNDKCLYVILQDECHWGLTPTGFVNMRIHKQLMLSASEHNNAVHVCVSATPENHFVIDALQAYNITKWDINKDVPICKAWESVYSTPASRYYGERMRPAHLTVADTHPIQSEDLLSFVAEVYDAQINRRQSRRTPAVSSLALMLDYVASFIIVHRTRHPGADRYSPGLDIFSSSDTREAVERCTVMDNNGQGSLCVVRMSCHTKLCEEFLIHLRSVRSFFGLDHTCAIMLCTGNESYSLSKQVESEFKSRMGDWLGRRSRTPSKLAFGDLVHMPGILILVAKGRMGDTFPSTMSHFDLRACYRERGDIVRSTFIQDAGRTFRVTQSEVHLPKLLLRPEAHRAYTDNQYDKPDGSLVKKRTDTTELPDDDEDEDKESDMDSGETITLATISFDEQSVEQSLVGVAANFEPSKRAAFALEQPSVEAMAKTVIMFAAPQIGKTGAYVHCCLTMREMIVPQHEAKLAINLCYKGQVKQKFFRISDALATLEAFERSVRNWLDELVAAAPSNCSEGVDTSATQNNNSNKANNSNNDNRQQQPQPLHLPQPHTAPTSFASTSPSCPNALLASVTMLARKRKADELNRTEKNRSERAFDCYFHTERPELLPAELEEKRPDTIVCGLAAVFDNPRQLTITHLQALAYIPALKAHSIIYIFTDTARDRMRQRVQLQLPQPLPSLPRQPANRSPGSMEVAKLHRDYYQAESSQLHDRFTQHPELWAHYHDLIEQSQREKQLSITRQFARMWYKTLTDTEEERSQREMLQVGDMGCGRCQLAKTLLEIVRTDAGSTGVCVRAGSESAGATAALLTVHVLGVDHVTDDTSTRLGAVLGNMRDTGWKKGSMQVMVYCLSLWGADRHQYINEAHRVLKTKGELYIIESKYRMGIDHTLYQDPVEVRKKCDMFGAEVEKRGFLHARDFNPPEFFNTPFTCQLFYKSQQRNTNEMEANKEALLDFPAQDRSREKADESVMEE